jgi:fatty-acyl-CoA synthase
MYGLMSERPLLISSLLDHAARYHGKTEIISSDSEGKITRSNYNEVNTRAKKIAQALIKLGAQKGDTIATMAWSNVRHYELYFGISGIGSICHTINPRLFTEQLIFIINDAKDKFLFVDIDFIPLIEKLFDKVSFIQKLIVLCDKKEMPQSSTINNLICYEELIESEDGEFSWPMFDEKTASSLCYTSGTTGNPKGVLYAHRSTVIHAFAAAAPDAMNLSARDVIMPIAPMFHANAWAIPYVTTMVGAKLVLPGRNLDGKSVQHLIESERVTFTAAVPTIWLMLFEYLEQSGKKLESLKSCVVGGSACPRFMMEKFYEKYGVEVLHCWGMTETSPIGTINRPLLKHAGQSFNERLDIAVKQGRPIYGVEIKITDENGITLPNNGKDFGNLWIRGPWICSGYLNIENSETHTEDDWFLTGDVATIDADGFMQITDRTKDVIKSGGEWISSIEIENFAVGHSSVMEAGVIGVFHPKWDERPLLILVKNENSEVTKEEILEFLKDKIASWWMPDDVVFVDSLPHTATGKIQKLVLREQFKDYKLEVE